MDINDISPRPYVPYPRGARRSERPRRDTISVPYKQTSRDLKHFGAAPRVLSEKDKTWRKILEMKW